MLQLLDFFKKNVKILKVIKMFKRDIEDKLINWKNQINKKALCIFGARQIGKTTSIRDFGKKNYECFCEINFFETPKAIEIFSKNLDANTIIEGISAFTMTKLIPGKTLVFLDEIQYCPNARCAIKFLVEDGRFDYIESGSMLGISFKDIPSLPVGFEEEYQMFPMSFKEFVLANGITNDTIDYLYNCFRDSKLVSDAIHETMKRLFLTYLIVGGMPEAVQIYLDTHDIAKVVEYQQLILNKYRQDISQYTDDSNKIKVKAIYDSIPSQLNKKNKRFLINSIEKNARLLRYQDSFNWLIDAGVALPCYNLDAPIIPLAINEKRNLFKLFMNDTGLLTSSSFDGVQFEILMGNVNVNMGSILENVIACELVSNGFELRYYDSIKNGEIDFVINLNNEVVLIEVKSGKDYHKHNFLDNMLEVKEWNLQKGIVLCEDNISICNNIVYLPWYMVMFIKKKKLDKLIYQVEIVNI